MSGGVHVRGGAAGLEVQYAELRRTAGLLGRAGAGLLGLGAVRHRILVDGDLLASAVLDPAGFARVEGALVQALDGPHGVAVAGARLEVRAGQLGLAVARYTAADRLADEARTAQQWLLIGAAPVLLPLGGSYLAGRALGVAAAGGDPAADLARLLTEHPGVLDVAVHTVPTLTGPLRSGLLGPLPVWGDQVFQAVTGETLLPGSVAESAGLLALLYDSQPPVVGDGVPDVSPRANQVPRGVADVLRRLHHRNGEAPAGTPDQGGISVTRIVTVGPDGVERVSLVVDLPGTKDWQHLPGPRPYLNDLATNLEVTAGAEGARLDALEQVLRRAREDSPGAPIMLVGHSQGGMLALRAAQRFAERYDVTHVVTAGSPVGGMSVGPGTQVLSLENAHDLVPHLDGADNDDGARHTTVTFDRQQGSPGANHGTGTAYVPGAVALEGELAAGRAEAVQVWLDSAHEFLAGRDESTSATTTVYPVSGSRPAGR